QNDDGSVLFRRGYEIDRQAAEVNRFADRIESHAGRQRRGEERLVLGEHRCAQQGRKRQSESTDTERKHNRRSSEDLPRQMTYCGCPASIRVELAYRTESVDCAKPFVSLIRKKPDEDGCGADNGRKTARVHTIRFVSCSHRRLNAKQSAHGFDHWRGYANVVVTKVLFWSLRTQHFYASLPRDNSGSLR